jgi:hypothetical protein
MTNNQIPTDAYPLYWPEGRPRTDRYRRETARFDTSFARARDSVARQVEMLCGKYSHQRKEANIVISTNVTLRRDGLPLAGQRPPDDPGVAVYFIYKKRQMCFACDRWRKIEDNMQAVAKTIEALRGVARWGTGDMMEAAFQGFTALPAPGRQKTWREVLGFPNGNPTKAQVEANYLRLRSMHHPDKGGDASLFHEVQLAYEQAMRMAT